MFIIWNKNSAQAGMTLVELMIALSLGVIVAVLMSAIATSSLKSLQSTKRLERLHANAAFTVDLLAYWVKQADRAEVSSPDTLVLTLSDGTVKTISLAGKKLLFDGGVATTNDIDVTSLAFTKLARSVRVSSTLEAAKGEESFSFMTTVAQRSP